MQTQNNKVDKRKDLYFQCDMIYLKRRMTLLHLWISIGNIMFNDPSGEKWQRYLNKYQKAFKPDSNDFTKKILSVSTAMFMGAFDCA